MKKIFFLLCLTAAVQYGFGQKMYIYTTTMGKIEIELSKIDSITFSVGGALEVSPNSIFLPVGGEMNAMINGGKTPYAIQTPPQSTIATASITGTMLTVHGMGSGATSMVIKDNSIPALTATVTINVTAGGGLSSNPPSLIVQIGKSVNSTISGGTSPYFIKAPPDPTIASAFMSGNLLMVQGIGLGFTWVVVKDNSVPSKEVMVDVTVTAGPGGLMVTKSHLSLSVGEEQTSSVSGGTSPYTIMTLPDPLIAQASITGNIVTVKGLGAGYTFLVVQDASVPYKTATIEINVRPTFTVPGSLSFNSTVKNFSANGIFINTDTLPTNDQGAGGLYSLHPGYAMLIGYVKNSSTNWDVVLITVSQADSDMIKPGSYAFNDTVTVGVFASFMYVVGWDPSGTSGDPFTTDYYTLKTGLLSMATFDGTSTTGTFSGVGVKKVSGLPDPAQPITVTAGNFSLPLLKMGGSLSGDALLLQKFIRQAQSRLR